jgi:hypothetical protein
MSKFAKLTWLALAFVTMLGLSACYPDAYVGNGSDGLREFTVTTKDGRIVPCVGIGHGIDCDWSKAKVPTYSTPNAK